ncbi:Crp/Fnr family transcriptional regulator [uncultured Rhodoblastus sp.]|uniref:Crp/Fnr family transcriptional regulator n=1 Tax=uncultured Rhodoblastus sp. TaxID=543037 RepID=UPI0025D60443|nr:Crp/Fnr family transcriptional regulator [uncultured Rhodoblastus sp.]
MSEVQNAASNAHLFDQCAVFHTLSDEARIELLKRSSRRHFTSGQVIFRYRTPGQSMMVLLSGEVRISLPEPNGRVIILADLQRGAILGEMSVLDGEERSADATALTACELLALERSDVLAFLERHPGVCLDILHMVCARLRDANERTLDLGFLDVPSRLAKMLLARAKKRGNAAPGGATLRISDSQSDLAAMIGASREKVNRSLKQMQQQGIVATRDGRIEILNPGALQSVAGLT